jgi:hypothetical protein
VFRRSGNEKDYLFWDDTWLSESFVLGERFPFLLGYFQSLGFRYGLCFTAGVVSEGQVRTGDVSCLCGRRNCWKVAVLCYITLFCMIMFLTDGHGGLQTPSLFRSRKLIYL